MIESRERIGVSPLVRPKEFARAGHPYLSSILRLFIYLSFFARIVEARSERDTIIAIGEALVNRSDSFRQVRNNLLNYRMPKVTSTRRDAWRGRKGEREEEREKGKDYVDGDGDGGCNGTDREDGRFAAIGIFHGILRNARVHTCSVL